MFFLLRVAFWLSVVIMLIPADPKYGGEAPRVSALEALNAARATIADLSAFCDRNPDVCATSDAAFKLFGEKAENGVRTLYKYFDDAGQPSGEAAPGQEQPAPSQSTLKREDMLPTWRGKTDA